MKYLFWSLVLLVAVFILPPWLVFIVALVLSFTKSLPLYTLAITGVVLDVVSGARLIETIPLYSGLGFIINLSLPFIVRRLRW